MNNRKRIAILLIGIGFTFISQAQIKHIMTFETPEDWRQVPESGLSQDVGLARFELLGEKIYYFDFNGFKMQIFNEDSTLFRSIEAQLQLDPMFFWDVPLEDIDIMGLSQHLFDTDDGIEFLVYLTYTPSAFSHSFSRRARYYVVDDDGSLLLRVAGSKVIKHPKLEDSETGTKMFLPITNFKTMVYSLPGKLPDLNRPKEEKESPIPLTFTVGDRISLNKVRFDQSSYSLREEAYPVLEILLGVMKENPGMTILLEGHTDNQGNADVNMKLSEDRVNEIKKYLVSNDIKSKRIKIKGFGETRPVASNDSEETRKLNRRVEMVVLKN